MGRAINKAVTIAEILKRKMALHQVNDLQSVEMIDVYEPVEEGLDVVTSRRYVSCIKITLSVNLSDFAAAPPTMDITLHSGYQPPLPDDEMHQPQQQQQQMQQQMQQQQHQQQQLLYHHHHLSAASSSSPHGSSNSPSVVMEYHHTTYATTTTTSAAGGAGGIRSSRGAPAPAPPPAPGTQ
jgi:Alba